MALVGILLADEIKSWREFVSSVLRRDPSLEVICEVSDGLKAVKMAEQLQPAVAVLNIELPNLGGIQAGGWIRMLAPNTKIVFLAERLEADIVQAAMKHGPEGYLLKSEAPRDLVAAIHAVGRGETFLSYRLAAHLVVGLKSNLERRPSNLGVGLPASPQAFSPISAHR
jgi:DNA-binding NarL/FixJ family response regulator